MRPQRDEFRFYGPQVLGTHALTMFTRTLNLSLAAALLMLGCTDVRTEVGSGPATLDASVCTECHGTPGVNAAPPNVSWDKNAPADYHQVHLVTTASRHAPIDCDTCHITPATLITATHPDGKVEVQFTGTATAGGANPAFAADTHTCSGVYCHGATLPGAAATALPWRSNGAGPLGCDGCHGFPPAQNHAISHECSKCHSKTVDASGAIIDADLHVNGTVDVSIPSCAACHGFPPPAPHVQRTDCSLCHPAVVDASNNLIPNGPHDNGTVDVSVASLACNACHGNAAGDASVQANWAPPTDPSGNTDTTLLSVGAHQAHLVGTTLTGATGAWHRPVVCTDCHVVPASVTAPGHLTGTPPVVVFGDVARRLSFPAFDATTGTCSNTACHTAFAQIPVSGVDTAPTWTSPFSLGCGTSCHSLPPGPALGHPADATCNHCHTNWDGQKFVDPTLHINGVVNF